MRSILSFIFILLTTNVFCQNVVNEKWILDSIQSQNSPGSFSINSIKELELSYGHFSMLIDSTTLTGEYKIENDYLEFYNAKANNQALDSNERILIKSISHNRMELKIFGEYSYIVLIMKRRE